MNYPLYSAEQIRALDRIAIKFCCISSYALMTRAGTALLDLIHLRWTGARRILIFCGAGNNAGDGYVLARLLKQVNKYITVYSAVEIRLLKGDAKRACADYLAQPGTSVLCDEMPEIGEYDLVVDALLGSGLSRPVVGRLARIIEVINTSTNPVLAVDVPSGINASTGGIMGVAVRSSATLTFIAQKRGLLTQDGPDYCGELFVDKLNLPNKIYRQVPSNIETIDPTRLINKFRTRKLNTHKGCFGNLLIAGGTNGMEGAVILAAHAALVSGAGLVRMASWSNACGISRMPDLIRVDLTDLKNFKIECKQNDVIAIGPGLGSDDWAKDLLQLVLAVNTVKVLDADALNLLAEQPQKLGELCVITPHPAEAARLLGRETREIQSDRFTAVMALSKKYRCTVILKGCGTLVCNGEETRLCTDGNPAMAVAGMGDVLTGIVAALLGQGFSSFEAAQLAVCLHAQAGDRAYRERDNGLLASHLLDYLPFKNIKNA